MGARVRIRDPDGGLWRTVGKVIGLRNGGRSAHVRINGHIYLRKCHFLREEPSEEDGDSCRCPSRDRQSDRTSGGDGSDIYDYDSDHRDNDGGRCSNEVEHHDSTTPRRGGRAHKAPDRQQAGGSRTRKKKKKKKKPNLKRAPTA